MQPERDTNNEDNAQVETVEKWKRKKGKNWFLTYSHCPLSVDEFVTLIKSNEEEEIKCLVVATEGNGTDNPHVHAYVQFKNQIYASRRSRFDYDPKYPCGRPETARRKDKVL
jgi:hypothetical protein